MTTTDTGGTPAIQVESGWTQGSADHLIELAHGLLHRAGELAREHGEPVPGWLAAYTKFQQLHHQWTQRDAEDTCHRCGRNFICWTAPSPLWNEVMRGGDPAGTEPYRGEPLRRCGPLLHLRRPGPRQIHGVAHDNTDHADNAAEEPCPDF